MTDFKGRLYIAFSFLIVFFQWTAFGISDSRNSLEAEHSFHFESQVFSNDNLKERERPVLFVLDQRGAYCVIPLDGQVSSLIGEAERTNTKSFAFEDREGLKSCQPEVIQMVWESLENKGNQVAAAGPFTIGAVIYVGVCGYADHVTSKRNQSQSLGKAASSNSSEFFLRMFVGAVCFPVYTVGVIMRWGQEEDKP